MSSVVDMTLHPSIHTQEPSFSSLLPTCPRPLTLQAHAPGRPARPSSSLPHRSPQPHSHLSLVESPEWEFLLTLVSRGGGGEQ